MNIYIYPNIFIAVDQTDKPKKGKQTEQQAGNTNMHDAVFHMNYLQIGVAYFAALTEIANYKWSMQLN